MDTARPDRHRYRQRLRSRIVLSFFALGLSLAALFGLVAVYASARVEDQLVGRALTRNLDSYAARFYRDRSDVVEPLDDIRGLVVGPGKRSKLQADWAERSNGVYQMHGEQNGQPFVYRLAVRKDERYWFFLAYDLTRTADSRSRQQWVIAALVAAFSLLSLLVGRWSASKVMRPVSDLVDRVDDLGRAQRASALAPHFSDDEVGRLAQAFDDYSQRLTEMVERDKEFNADVSHELRTPLMVIKGATELALARTGLEPALRNRLQRIQRAEQQCSDLIAALLLLSRNERDNGHAHLAKVAEQLIDAHRHQLGRKPVTLRIEGDRDAVVPAPEATVAVALGNLVSNAVKYTAEGEVVIRIAADWVEVADSGPGLSQSDADNLFRRGYRGTHAGNTQGGGIGLSIVRRLCGLYDWRIEVRPGTPCGLVARLRFSLDAECGNGRIDALSAHA
ncbi:histidine kinase dimerization/phospho-acceptor domain-containing protein [Lysobacter enzymogenes]|uniref:sensor histidine kinase n=1 Tax=Lysobacter enzymogenes TaxID=69 RepID=UPI00384EF37B